MRFAANKKFTSKNYERYVTSCLLINHLRTNHCDTFREKVKRRDARVAKKRSVAEKLTIRCNAYNK